MSPRWTGDRIGFGAEARSQWDLADELCFLNHGSFGAVPRALQVRATECRNAIEHNPVAGVWRDGSRAIRASAERVAAFLGSHPDRTGFVSNATNGINALLQSIPLDPGDEVLHLDHGYNAVWQTLVMTGRRRGIVPRKVEIPLPVRRADDWIEAVDRAITPRTRLLVLDQVTSPTALVLPTREIVEMAKAQGVETIVDGAHAPGMLDRPATSIGDPLAWTGNLHKWPCGLRGTAVLVVRADFADRIKPTVISHHLDQSFSAEFDWQGTFDPVPWILAGEAIDFMDRFGGWREVRRRNRELVIEAHAMLVERLGVEPISPLDGSSLGFMATLPLPDRLQPGNGGPPAPPSGPLQVLVDPVQDRLLDEHRIEIPVMHHGGRRLLRLSGHVYNEPSDYERLAEAVEAVAVD